MDVNQSSLLLSLMALSLGARHGFDLDHLATIDAITQTVREHRFLSKIVGFLFSLGHGIIVTLISIIIGSGLIQSRVPEWLEVFGTWVSMIFLFLFGFLNLWTIFQNPTHGALPSGIKSYLAKKIFNRSFNPCLIMFIGALFAFSFDTFSQVALFSLSASVLAGWLFSGVLGLIFMVGMMLSDGLNGFFVSTLIQRADRLSLFLSRSLGLAISLFSIVLGVITLVKMIRYTS